MLPTYDLNKFTECDFESHYSESKSSKFEYCSTME